ncbi:MAG: peptidase T [Bdellovibrionales bacterium RIFOXYD12_FULL_39_22]|nr:MAG: peptidase T [Bdellovibrionales bacterium RIFOXYB1_FULL_39_21]OFZ43965.1 MAG: peptidase T [Bdellovibrionales bacterium RIFOXYC12_FULL_39_17]OFZ48337.1 MAG: peptidase T [Bdellovibrionales bacterium RIFOXYC1_FULL_39_130]OFZ76642.1 MAG: peptidase T [Bdellovibrionales bacterium RIFOXYD1_FULL_39_84]OFZ94928.1 MAG: peptidase T [Bdellovibrionales bacterium RIFOXYD12_FULL_39_22]HLE12650.1 peptidase T [Bacteriovoracaceae bacterium]
MEMKESLWNRFQKYVKIDTQANSKSSTVPSSSGQELLARELQKELEELGVKNSYLDRGYLYFSIEGSKKTAANIPAIGFLAHLDTAEDASGKNVRPKRHSAYSGGDIKISDDVILSPQHFPELADYKGHDIVTASGDTLLGADNKAGVAILMTLVELLQKKTWEHGPIYFAFTPDEEIGRGMDHFDVKRFAAEAAYTVDGDLVGFVENETFNADELTIEISGKSVHPGSAKNKMANAVIIASDIIAAWPANMLPESTEKHEGFIGIMSVSGGVEKASIRGIVRDHDLSKMHGMEELMAAIVEEKKKKYPLAQIVLKFREQYRNMKIVIDKHPQVMKKLLRSMESVGITPRIKPVRGGTDGARLSFMGVPTPNIFVGGSNYHGRYEWISLDGMHKSLETLVALTVEWGEK